MTKTEYWLSVIAVVAVLLSGSLAVSPFAFAADEDDDDEGERDDEDDERERDDDDDGGNKEPKTLESECAEILDKKRLNLDGLFCMAIFALQESIADLQNQIDNIQLIPGPPGDQGQPGNDGKDGINCWDLDGNGVKDLPDEDVNGDGIVDVLDCKGPKGDKGDAGEATAIPAQTCPENHYVSGIDSDGSLICSEFSKPELSIDDVSIQEGNSGTKTLMFTVSLVSASLSTVTVDYATVDQTAVSVEVDGKLGGNDFVATSGTLTIPAGQVSATISVTINGDLLPDGTETFQVVLSNPTNAVIVDDIGIGTIVGDDGIIPGT